MKLLERSTRKESLDGSFGNPFWWKHSDGTNNQNYHNETTRTNHQDSWSKQHRRAGTRKTTLKIMEIRAARETGVAARESQPLRKLSRQRKPAWKDEPTRESLVAERASVLKILFGGSTQMEQTTKTITMKRLERVIRIHGASNAGEPARERRPPRIVEMRGASDAGALSRES